MAPIAKGKVTTTGLARSRNTTPLSATSTEPGSVARKTTPLVMSYREISELCRNSTTPSPAILRRLVDGLRQRSDAARIQASHHDTSFRDASKRKARELEKQHELEVARTREEEEVRSRAKPRFPSPKKEEESEEERPLAVGARGLARQDGAPPEGLFFRFCVIFLFAYLCLLSKNIWTRTWTSMSHIAVFAACVVHITPKRSGPEYNFMDVLGPGKTFSCFRIAQNRSMARGEV